MQIDDKRLDEDRDRNVRLVYAMHQAVEEDLAASPIDPEDLLTRSKLQERYYASYPKSKNKTPFDTAYRYIGIVDHGKKGMPTRIRGVDVYRIARFFLVNLHAYGWENLKQTLRDAGPPYDELVKLEDQATKADKMAKLSSRKVGDLINMDEDPGDQLRRLADKYDDLKVVLKQTNTSNDILIKENSRLRRAAKNTRSLIHRLLEKMATEQDADKRDKIVREIIKANKKLDDLIS